MFEVFQNVWALLWFEHISQADVLKAGLPLLWCWEVRVNEGWSGCEGRAFRNYHPYVGSELVIRRVGRFKPAAGKVAQQLRACTALEEGWVEVERWLSS